MQSFLSRDKKRGFYSKFHEKPPESFTLGNDMIWFLFSKQIPSATCGEELWEGKGEAERQEESAWSSSPGR